PRPVRWLELAGGLTIRLPAEEEGWLDEGSAIGLRGEYRAIPQRIARAYRQGLSATAVAEAIRKAEAAVHMPLLEAVLTFLGRAEGLKNHLLQ
ncbi:hypothetical protein OFC17_30320, partial [Escherichia coli]|nr:hypothetical protein [Escherichia coli]